MDDEKSNVRMQGAKEREGGVSLQLLTPNAENQEIPKRPEIGDKTFCFLSTYFKITDQLINTETHTYVRLNHLLAILASLIEHSEFSHSNCWSSVIKKKSPCDVQQLLETAQYIIRKRYC